MGKPRPESVDQLVRGALGGMLEYASRADCTADEVLSAYFTLTKRGIITTLQASPSETTRAALRASLLSLLMDCADTAQH